MTSVDAYHITDPGRVCARGQRSEKQFGKSSEPLRRCLLSLIPTNTSSSCFDPSVLELYTRFCSQQTRDRPRARHGEDGLWKNKKARRLREPEVVSKPWGPRWTDRQRARLGEGMDELLSRYSGPQSGDDSFRLQRDIEISKTTSYSR